MTCKISNRDPLQSQRPGGQQMKPTIPGEIIDPGGGFEKDDRRAVSRRRVTSDEFCYARNFDVIEPAEESALEALGEEFSEHGIC